MSCGKARMVTYLADRLVPVSPQSVEAQKHLQSCPQCRAFVLNEEAFTRVLRSHLPQHRAPAHLREKILGEIAQARSRRRLPVGLSALSRKQVAAAILVTAISLLALLAGIFGHQALTGDTEQRMVATLIEDHLRFRPGASEIASSEAAQVESWFTGKVEFEVRVPRFDQAEVLGGRLCYLLGRKGALVTYQVNGALLSFYTLEGTDVHPDRFKGRHLGGNLFAYSGEKGHSLVLWKDRGLVYALVSPLPERKLIQLASEIPSQQG